MASILAALLALNVTWLLGFTSFLLGAALMSATLALWWGGREWFGLGPSPGALQRCWCLGYFCHPISLGLTIAGLRRSWAVLTPGINRTVVEGSGRSASLIPLGPARPDAYLSLTRSGGGIVARLATPGEVPGNVPVVGQDRFGWVDPISLVIQDLSPVRRRAHSWGFQTVLLAPALWVVVAVGLLAASTGWKRAADRRGWLALAVLLMLGGLLGPDTLGVKHGHYLPQRVGLLGLVALVPWLDLAVDRWSGRLASGLLVVALVVQSAFVWDYALDCRDRLGPFAKAAPAIGSNKRVGTLLVGIKGRFRANPMLHADCLFGVVADHVIWNNYETAHYYFPVKVRPGLDHPNALAFERVALLDGSGETAERAQLWEKLLDEHGDAIDVIVEWDTRDDPALDAINARRYDPTYREGPVRVWTRREPPGSARGTE